MIVLEKFENNTIEKDKILFLLVFIKMFSLSSPGRLWEYADHHLGKKKIKKKSPEKKTAYKKFLLYCEELESKFPLMESCFLKWVEKIPTAGFKDGPVLEFVGWQEDSVHKKGWTSSLQERLYIGLNLYLLKKKNDRN
jgi:hypothetical protein